MIARFSIEDAQADWALAYRFDIVIDRIPGG
jgi:hypothetical protein